MKMHPSRSGMHPARADPCDCGCKLGHLSPKLQVWVAPRFASALRLTITSNVDFAVTAMGKRPILVGLKFEREWGSVRRVWGILHG